MSEATINIKIGSRDLEILKNNGYNLCLIREVEFGRSTHAGNVVFSTLEAKDLAPVVAVKMDLDRCQVFGTEEFLAGSQVKVDTDLSIIAGGQTATIDTEGHIALNGSAQPGKAFDVENKWKHPARIAVSNYDNISQGFVPFYVSPKVLISSASDFLPLQTFGVFWDMNLDRGDMFDRTTTPPFPVNLTVSKNITIQYEEGIWSVVSHSS